MQKIFLSVLLVLLFTACNNDSNQKEGVGDSMRQDPTTGQPITTAPDTVGTAPADSINRMK